jgi:hypothetical protein
MTARLSLLEALQQNPHLHVARISLVITYVELGDLNTARKQTNDLRNHYPGLTRDALAERIPTSSERQEQIRCALKAAGY